MTAEDCSTCPMCSLIAWIEDQLDAMTDEQIEKNFKFNIPVSTWKKKHFTKQHMFNLPIYMKKYSPSSVGVYYNRTMKAWIIDLDLT